MTQQTITIELPLEEFLSKAELFDMTEDLGKVVMRHTKRMIGTARMSVKHADGLVVQKWIRTRRGRL